MINNMEENIKKLLSNDLDNVYPRKDYAKKVLTGLSQQIVTDVQKNRLSNSPANKVRSLPLNNLLLNIFMNKKAYLGIAAAVIAGLASLAVVKKDSLMEYAQRFRGPKTQFAVADKDVEEIATDIEEISDEIDAVAEELDELDASLDMKEVDDLMKDLDEIPNY